MPDIILHNARIATQDAAQPHASAVAIRAGRFLAVGGKEILALSHPETRLLNLEGALVLPGLTDSHFHLRTWALGLKRLDLSDSASLEELCAKLVERTRHTPPGEWIVGHGWNETRWPAPAMPDRAALDAAAPHHPVLLWRNDLHLAVANSRALRLGGIDANTANPPQGVIDRQADGFATGILREEACGLVTSVIPASGEQQTLEAVRGALPALHRLGLTGVHELWSEHRSGALSPLRIYQRLQEDGSLSLRLWACFPLGLLGQAIEMGLRTGFGGGSLWVGHVKMFADGSQGARTAWMLEPYEDTGTCGMPRTAMQELARAIERAHQAGIAAAVHAIGDRAIRELVTTYEDILGKMQGGPAPAAPHRIEHVQNIRPPDVRRLAKLGVTACGQPIHIVDDIPMIEQSVGERGRFAYPFRDLQDAGVLLAFGSDCPVADPNPFWGIHAAVTRQRRDGTPQGGWYAEQRLTVQEAVWAYTMGPALASGLQNRLGSITPGKQADLIALDRNIYEIEPALIAETRVLLCMVDGQIVHRA
jgi:predicted amidohydrolase YtcJ